MPIRLAVITLAFLIMTSGACLCEKDSNNMGFLENPPVFFDNEPDIPLVGMAIGMPKPGQTIPDFDTQTQGSDGFRKNGVNVQPQLSVKYEPIRIGALHGFNDGWAAGISIPWFRMHARGFFADGSPAQGISEGLGDIALIGKKQLWTGQGGDKVVFTGGVEVPTGKSDGVFAEVNAATRGYYRNSPGRMPISWQPGAGSLSGYVGLSYGKQGHRISYAALLLAKLHTPGDEDVKIGDTLITAVTGTYGIGKNIAGSLALTLRSQADDSYPNAPPPGVDSLALQGTTEHGVTLYLDPSVRFIVMKKFVVGFGVRTPIVKPDDGRVPDTRYFVIVYPAF